MPKALMPLPRLVVPTSCETKGLCHMHVKDVESICTSGYLGEKASVAIPDVQDPMLDQHARAVLIHLPQAHDGVPQRGDVVDASEQPVLSGLGGEDDGADTLDLHGGGIPELDGASHDGIELGEELPSTGHVMGCAGVEAPPAGLVLAGAVAKKGMSFWLVEVEESRCGRGRWS